MISEEKMIKMRDGVEIFTRVREIGAPAWIIVTHGVAEHSGRHQYISDIFGHQFNILHYDLRGHGKSEGKRTFVEKFEDYYGDLREMIDYLTRNYKMKDYALFGHSMGALITAGVIQSYLQTSLYPKMVFFSAPPAEVGGMQGRIVHFLPQSVFEKLSSIPYSIPIPKVIKFEHLSHDPMVGEDYTNDSLNSLSIHSRLLFEIVRAGKDVFTRPLRLKCAGFCAVGGADQVVSPEAINKYFIHLEKGVQVKVIPSAYHELHNEIAKYRKHYIIFLKKSFYQCFNVLASAES
jgi:alpha-beta hydrolase superfamily lysophospholipase